MYIDAAIFAKAVKDGHQYSMLPNPAQKTLTLTLKPPEASSVVGAVTAKTVKPNSKPTRTYTFSTHQKAGSRTGQTRSPIAPAHV